jgi:TRAP-type mannitol/chloroaromatic compound transport system permease large subunit
MIAIAIVLTLLLVAGLPISYAFALAGSFALWFTGEQQLNVISRMFSGLDTFVLMAAPFYVFAGELMNRGGISERIIHLAQILVGRVRAGTAYLFTTSASHDFSQRPFPLLGSQQQRQPQHQWHEPG